MTNKRKALLAAAVAALLTVPGVAMASGAFDGGGHSATVEEVTATIDQSTSDVSDDSIGDSAGDASTGLSDDVNEATEADDSADSADDVAEMEDTSDDVDEATEVEDSADGPDDQSDDQSGGAFDDGDLDLDTATAGFHS